MEIIKCTKCKMYHNLSDAEEKTTSVSYCQIDPPDQYYEFPCGYKVESDNVDIYENEEILELLNK